MPKRSAKSKDENQLAKSVIDQIIAKTENAEIPKIKNPATPTLRKRGNSKNEKAHSKIPNKNN